MNQVQHRKQVDICKQARGWTTGFDTTGEGLSSLIPKGCIRMSAKLVHDYKERGYIVCEGFPVIVDGESKLISLVDFANSFPEFDFRRTANRKAAKHDATRRPTDLARQLTTASI